MNLNQATAAAREAIDERLRWPSMHWPDIPVDLRDALAEAAARGMRDRVPDGLIVSAWYAGWEACLRAGGVERRREFAAWRAERDGEGSP